MGKKYLDIKKDSLEDSILNVWQTAAEEAGTKMDGRTKGYKSHRSKLEANRLARIARAENRRKSGFVEGIKNRIKEFAFGGYNKTQPVADMRTDVPKKKKKNAKN